MCSISRTCWVVVSAGHGRLMCLLGAEKMTEIEQSLTGILEKDMTELDRMIKMTVEDVKNYWNQKK